MAAGSYVAAARIVSWPLFFLLWMKGVIVGEAGVGKSSILMRFENNLFTNDFRTTIGVNFVSKEIEVGGKRVTFQIQDTAGQERFRKITSSHYRGVDFVIVAYDVSDRQSFNRVHEWIDDMCDSIPETAQVVIIGNKSDVESRSVGILEGVELGKEYNVLFLETSAKANVNIDLLFTKLALKSNSSDPEEASKVRRYRSLPGYKSKRNKFHSLKKKLSLRLSR